MTNATRPLTEEQKALVDEPHLAFVTTLNPDGSPQTTAVWIDRDGDTLTFNTSRGRVKTRNLEQDPRLSVGLHDPNRPYDRVLTASGRAELVDEGGADHIERLAQKYTGQPFRGFSPGERRVTVRLSANRILWGSQ